MFAVEARGLTKRFGEFTAVDHIDLLVESGRIFGLLGPNGAGKTTTIRMITGLLKPTEGYVRVYGMDVLKNRRSVLRMIGYMPQRSSLYDDLTVEENLYLYTMLYDFSRQEAKRRTEELLKEFFLDKFRDRLVGNLSGGMKRRLALAITLVHDPKLLILDEPTVGVDPPLRRQFWERFRQLVSKGKTILVTTHYMDEAENCDEIALISHGRMIASGTPEAIKRRAFGGELIEVLLDREPPCDPPEFAKIISVNGRKVRLLVDDYGGRSAQLMDFLRERGFKILEMRPVRVSLEDAFIRLMGERS